MKKMLLSWVLLVTMALGMPIAAFANDNSTLSLTTSETSIETNLNSMDLNKPFTITENFTNDEGENVTITLDFEPTPNEPSFQLNGSKDYTATVGTWRIYYDGPFFNQSYRIDVSKSGTQWKLSNAREHDYDAPFAKFSNASLKITRSLSTPSFPAEANASVYAQLFDTTWIGPIWSGTEYLRTNVSNNGTLTVSWG